MLVCAFYYQNADSHMNREVFYGIASSACSPRSIAEGRNSARGRCEEEIGCAPCCNDG